MPFLLDTNVLSEGLSRRPNPHVGNWIGTQSAVDLHVSVLSFGEIRKGVELRFHDARRAEIEHWLTSVLPARFIGRVLGVTEEVALEWGRLTALGQKNGRVLPVVDGLLLATATVHGLTLVTRNERDCGNRGVPILNPWSS